MTHPKNRAEMTHLWNRVKMTRPNWAEMTHPWNRAETTWPNGNRTETTQILCAQDSPDSNVILFEQTLREQNCIKS